MEAEVREQLSHLFRQKQDTIVGILGVYEPTVFETREMPHLAPHHHQHLHITKMEGARPQAGRPYPVAPQHLPELVRQIEVLERAGIICVVKVCTAHQCCLLPKRMGNCACVSTIAS